MEKNYIYNIPSKDNWSGRNSHTKEYWHENVFLHPLGEFNDADVGIIGFVCDAGVRRNGGRIGAAQAPGFIRKQLGKLAFHMNCRVADFGDIVCVEDHMESAQDQLAKAVNELLQKNIFTLVLGGGHEVAYGHFCGIQKACKAKGLQKIGIINFDAHFDLRTFDKTSHSGTPFLQILSESDACYMPIGIQKESNPRVLFDTAYIHHVPYILNEECQDKNIDELKTRIAHFISSRDAIYVSVDMDCFSAAYAPGVSAPSPVGITPYYVLLLLDEVFKSKKVIACDIAELNPTYDQDEATARLAARLANFICEKAKV